MDFNRQQQQSLSSSENPDLGNDVETGEYFDDTEDEDEFISDDAEELEDDEKDTSSIDQLSSASSDDEPNYDGYERDRHIEDIPVTLEFILGSIKLTIDDIKNLTQNVILHIDSGATANVAITCSGKKLGYGEIVSVNGQLGIRVVSWGG